MAKTFRNDINGLRAYAVIAVVLYHFGIGFMPGGFVGVDVFFVLSGFLMTGIVLGGLEKKKFSLGQFYLGRARRIIPALAVLCVALLAFGWFWLAPSDYATLGKHSAGAMSFTSNFTFKDEEGYFDAPSQTKWLLHSWSLSVEWQFYLLYPLLLAGFARFVSRKPSHLNALLWLVGVASFIACVFVSPRNNAFAFYLLPTRAWEMVLGGLVYCYAARLRLSMQASMGCESAGLALIVMSAIAFTTDLAWPGIYALVPAGGAALVLLATHQDSPFTSHRVLQAIGNWSYSIYLWHWPLAVGLGYFGHKGELPWILGAVAVSVLLGYGSYRWVEQPTRRYFTVRHWRTGTVAAIGSILLIGGIGAAVDHGEEFAGRVPADIAAIDRETTNRFALPDGCGFNRTTQELTPCIIGDAPVRQVILGDSHARSIVGAVQAALPGGIQFYSHQCATIFDSELRSKGNRNHCPGFMRSAWEQIQVLPRDVGVIVINRYAVNVRGPNEGLHKPWGILYNTMTDAERRMDTDALYKERLASSLCLMAKHRPVTAVLPIPEMGRDVPMTLVRQRMAGHDVREVTLPLATYRERNAPVVAALQEARARCGITLLDPVPYLCEGDTCYGAKDAQPRYFDDDHLSETGSRLLVPMFRTLKR